MATEGIISDVGAIYKRLFHHRPVIQNEVNLFVREFETRRGNGDLQCLQSCMSMVSEMEAVYLEDIAAFRPHFKAIHSLAEEVSELCSGILGKEREDLTVSSSEQERLDEEVEQYKLQVEQEAAEYEASFKVESERLEEEIRAAHTARARLRTVSVGSYTGPSLSINDSPGESWEGEGGGGGLGEREEEEEEEEEEEQEEDGTGEEESGGVRGGEVEEEQSKEGTMREDVIRC